MSVRTDRDRLERELAAAQRRVAELERELLHRWRDPLTGVEPIEPFRLRLADELRRAGRNGGAGALVLLAVDGLADIHREHGFAAGDALLSAVAGAVRAHAGGGVARAAQDAFALLASEPGAAPVEALLAEIARLHAGAVHAISASAGIAPFARGGGAVELFVRAERALADARAAGGGRAVVAAAGEPDEARSVVLAAVQRRDAVGALAVALLERDRYTGEHSESVVDMAAAVARSLGLSPSQVENVRAAALLHDIGKVGIPDAILNKPGPLTPDEREIMAEHPVIGERILRAIDGFAPVAAIVRHEHESWDGSGYPDRLSGAQIPIGSRIILACDAYHAMTSDRPYRARMSHADAFAELGRCAGRQFDPDVTAALIGYFYNERARGRKTV